MLKLIEARKRRWWLWRWRVKLGGGGRAPIKNDQNFHLLNDSTIYSWRPLVWSGQREGEWSWHCVGETEIGRERERERQRERDRERDRQTERERDRQREIVCRWGRENIVKGYLYSLPHLCWFVVSSIFLLGQFQASSSFIVSHFNYMNTFLDAGV